ncbi:MAG TPA: tRNA (adenosine(37)-N6)-dimethylallyltransferase MiaA, partial [Chitinophagaceae bacterium]|nr:tRNA (adenosine(37)-N6)-dimethylallyltransferase MiaA [Chitinophagaceae bacterium]
LELPRDILYARINARVDQMMADGLLEEARGLWPYRHLNALQTVGYRELFEYFEESGDKEDPVLLSKAVEKIKQNTRHYAKRQMTWFRREPGIISAAPDPKQVIRVLSDILT